jgi:hypothetical protein
LADDSGMSAVAFWKTYLVSYAALAVALTLAFAR